MVTRCAGGAASGVRFSPPRHMKLISLNTWGGKYFEDLIDFIKAHLDADIFCFQEIYNTTSDVKAYKDIRANLLSEIKNILPNFNFFFFPTLLGNDDKAEKTDFDLSYGLATFVRKSIKIEYYQSYFIYKPKSLKEVDKEFSNIATPLQVTSFHLNEKKFLIFNFHGTPYPGPKKDTPKRINQSKSIKNILNYFAGEKILVGDFNLLPETESIKLLDNVMVNLIKKYKIERTRSRLSPFWGKEGFQKFADYTFVSKEVKVKSFEVPDVKISDHLPMILEFD